MKISIKQKLIYSGILVVYLAVMVVLICILRHSCSAKPVVCHSSVTSVEKAEGGETVVRPAPCQCVEDIGNNITIWLGVIGAICTILPVVLGFRQSIDSQQMMTQLRSEVDEDKRKVKEEMKKHQEEMKKHQDEMDAKQKHQLTISCLNSLLLSVSHLCNIRDIKFKGDLPISSSPIIRPMLESIYENSEEACKQYFDLRDNCPIQQKTDIFYAALEALNSIRNLAQIYEDVVNVKTMVQLQSLRDSISLYLKQWVEKVETLANKPDYNDTRFREWLEAQNKITLEPVDPLYEVKLAAQKIRRIIVDELERKEKEEI